VEPQQTDPPQISNPPVAHHDVFAAFGPPWEGQVEAGFGVNFLGVKTRGFIWPEFVRPVAESRYVSTSYPGLDDDYLEWISVLGAVRDARKTFTMLELGAGWARWTVNAALAARRRGGLSCSFIAVEAEPTHYDWARIHIADNDVGSVKLVRAAVAPTEGDAWFYVGLPGQWYGQALAPERVEEPERGSRVEALVNRIRRRSRHARAPELDAFLQTMSGDPSFDAYARKVRTITLSPLLSRYDEVDLIHFDIQGAELDVLRSAAPDVDARVRRVHIGTHSDDVEHGIQELFSDLRWKPIFQYGLNSRHETPWGTITLIDGVHSYENPRLG
jgi:FkbM family methyltransferase